MDATLLMNLQEKVMAWPNLPDGAIAPAIFGRTRSSRACSRRRRCWSSPRDRPIQRGTDIRFLRRLARRNGFDCFVQPEPITGLDQGFFRPPSRSGRRWRC